MIIKNVRITNLYGYLNKFVEFNSDINLIVGINGSGKTSLLNVINWLLNPSFPDLCTNEFDELSIEFVINKDLYVIVSKQYVDEVTLEIKNITKNIVYHKIQADLKIHPKKIAQRNIDIESLLEEYRRLSPVKEEIESWNMILDEIPNPIVIGLDRNLYTEEGNDVAYVEDKGVLRRRLSSRGKKSPLERVIRLSSAHYARYKNRILELNKRLNDKIMLSSFDETLTIENINELLHEPKINLRQVQSLEVKVKEYFAENFNNRRSHPSIVKSNEEAFKKIEAYFVNLKFLVKQFYSNEKKDRLDIVFITNLNQFRKIRELIREFEDFETKTKKFYEPLKQYLDTLNSFLNDSAKELYFDKNNSKLQFRVINQKKETVMEGRDIKDLSSGELQILILFTFIKFNHQLGNLFIIDEPELSLHPKWQENFIDGIKRIMPNDTQLIFATHSPAIVGKNKDYCKVLMPF
ncbi:AAA family ATPase [Sphingobacterium deserti]|uniref:ABC transporter ATP-binding protein n=1 Tax=Sphingobacterium deserti TaxID=1229276 RepID=A0A0B8T5S0_9SPHI|nr:AAA family ATPase [Sphingobacterium deserti]KGE16078.1 ABC transporter ATP-binding protein [Sphingobacterium deserti]